MCRRPCTVLRRDLSLPEAERQGHHQLFAKAQGSFVRAMMEGEAKVGKRSHVHQLDAQGIDHQRRVALAGGSPAPGPGAAESHARTPRRTDAHAAR